MGDTILLTPVYETKDNKSVLTKTLPINEDQSTSLYLYDLVDDAQFSQFYAKYADRKLGFYLFTNGLKKIN